MSISKMFKGAVAGAAEWVGATIGGAVGGPKGAIIGQKIGSSLGDKIQSYGGGGGNFQPRDTLVQIPSYGGKMPTFQPMSAKRSIPEIRVSDFETLSSEWETRLSKYIRTAAAYERTTEISQLMKRLKA